MYRLLIVDDEAIITDGLSEVFSKFDIELDVCKAYSGYEALKIMNRHRVDIVITDIRMPGMDGIKLMENITRDWPHCKIIFLTGYDDFDYVYQAIQKPGVSYILKTEGYRKVKDMVRKAVHQLNDELHMKDFVKQSAKQQSTLETLLQSEYFRHVMKGSRGIHELKNDFAKLHIPLDCSRPIIMVLGVLDMAVQHDSYVNRQQVALEAKGIVDVFLQDHVQHITVLDRYHDLLWFIQPDEGAEEADYAASLRYLEGTFELIEQACSEALGVPLAVTIAVHPISWEALSEAYDKLRQLQNDRVGDGLHMVQTVLIDESKEATRFVGASRQNQAIEHVELLAIHLESGRKTEFFELLERIAGMIGDGHEADPYYAMECYYSIAFVLLTNMNRHYMDDKVNRKMLMSFEDHHSWSEAFLFLQQAANQLFSHRQYGEQNRAKQAVQQIQAYIEEHLDENLSLMRLSELIYFNSSYLSRLFKQVTGVNLSEYIEERRIKKAKELLKAHELKIAEVGAKIGYNAPHSFTRFFKKITGLTPQEYRDSRGGLSS